MTNKSQHPAAHIDGIHLKDACCDAVVTVNADGPIFMIGIAHDDGCPALDGDPVAREKAARALARLVNPDGPTLYAQIDTDEHGG